MLYLVPCIIAFFMFWFIGEAFHYDSPIDIHFEYRPYEKNEKNLTMEQIVRESIEWPCANDPSEPYRFKLPLLFMGYSEESNCGYNLTWFFSICTPMLLANIIFWIVYLRLLVFGYDNIKKNFFTKKHRQTKRIS
jgi:hypothetical protein